MKPHIVMQGDCFASIAARHGVSVDDVVDHDKNSALKEKRPNRHVLHPGDVVWVPDPPEPKSLPSGGTHRYKAPQAMTNIRLFVRDASGVGLDTKPWRMRVGRSVTEGTTEDDGLVEVKVPVSAMVGELTLWPGGTIDEGETVMMTVRFGGIDPSAERSGVIGRLQNLGYPAAIDFVGSVMSFQKRHGIKATGVVDEATLSALEETVGV